MSVACLEREGQRSLDHLLGHLRRLARTPERHAVADAIDERTAVRRFAPLERARDADELGHQLGGRHAHDRIAMAATVGEMEMRRDHPLRALYVHDGPNGPDGHAFNVTVRHGVRSALELARTGDEEAARPR